MTRSLFRPARHAAAITLILAISALLIPATTVAGSPAPVFDPHDFSGHPIDNAWFPLTPGTTLVYRGVKDGMHATNIIHVTHRTKIVAGVQATVIEDTLVQDGRVREHTIDWYAQDDHGNVWYLGERTATYDRRGNIEDTEGSWETGVDGARAGIFMPAQPHVGDSYQQEYYPGHAEDHFRVMSLDVPVKTPYGDFDQALRTREWTPLEPGVRDAKFYARGIGEVVEMSVRGPREVLKLVQVIRPTH
ncbi:MAG: hypothetical protein ABIP53_08200 [Candidatus Limnocylindrales bacterium]